MLLFWFSSFPGLLWLLWIGFSDTGFFLFHFIMILFYIILSEGMSTIAALPAEELKMLFRLLKCSPFGSHCWQKCHHPCPCPTPALSSCVWQSGPGPAELRYLLPMILKTICTTFRPLLFTLNRGFCPEILLFLCCFLPDFSVVVFSQWLSEVVHPLLFFFFFP